jgi:hypothetical protein
MTAEGSGGPKRRRRRYIDFGCEIPFKRVPDLVQQGFQELTRYNNDEQVLAHYHTAYCCLESSLGDARCDVMLMLVLAIAASTETPEVRNPGKAVQIGFTVGPRREPQLLAANMVTRMLWFLKPEAFPWKQNKGDILRVSEMVKKMGKSS